MSSTIRAPPASELHRPVPDLDSQHTGPSGQHTDTNHSALELTRLPPNQASARPSRSRANGGDGQRSTPPKNEASQRHGQGANTRSSQTHWEHNHVLPIRPPPREQPQTRDQNYRQPHSQQSRYTQQSGPSQRMPSTDSRVQNVVPHRQTHRQGQPPLRGQPNHDPAAVPHEAPFSNYTHRPTPQHRQLYDPRTDGSRQNRQPRDMQLKYGSADPVRDQVAYLQTLASIEIPRAEMRQQELDKKEDLRLSLEQICRDAVTQYERKKDQEFDANLVVLKCFGSLSSGFATHSSDMDLAILSPKSTPALSSVESEIPRLLEKTLLDLGFGVRLLTRTRVPIIKFCEKPTPDLVQALLSEREKWEKERDAPPQPKVDKTSAKDGDQESKDGAQNALDLGSTHANDNLKNGGKTNQALAHDSNHDGEDKSAILPVTPGENLDSASKGDEEKTADDVPRSDDELVYLYKLAMDEGWYDAEERKIIKNFLLAVSKHGPGSEDASLQAARLELKSLTKILHKYRAPVENHLDFPKSGVGIQCDINFSNPLALHNTLMLKCYSLCDPRVRPMILFVKAWAKRRNINSPYHGTLSSYGYVLMVLHYLVNIANPSIAPNLQTTRKAAQDQSPGNDEIIDGYGVRFWRAETDIKDLARHGMLTRNATDSVGSLLRGFFHYYAQQGFYSPSGGFCWAKDVLSLRTERGLLTKQEKDWTGAKTVTVESTIPGGEAREIRHRYLLAIEDPFETDHNIARTVVHNGIVAIRDEFRRAHSIIQGVGRTEVQDLFAEAQIREHLGWRAFGPLPKKDDAAIQSKDQPAAAGASSTNEKPVSGVKEKLSTGTLRTGEPACSSEEKPTEEISSEGKSVRGNNDQPAKKALNGNQNPSHKKKSLVKDTQVPAGNESSSITPPSRDSAKGPTKRRHRPNKENLNRQDGSKPQPSRLGKQGPAENPPHTEIKENVPPPHSNNSTLAPGIHVTAPPTREPTSFGSKSKSATQGSTYMHHGLVCNIQAPAMITRDSAPSTPDSSLSLQRKDIRAPDETPENGQTGAGVAASSHSGAGWAPCTM